MAKRVEYCRWFRDVITANGEDILDVRFFTDEAWFRLSGYVNSQNSRVWSAAICTRPRIRCTISRHWIIGPILFDGTIISERYCELIRCPFIGHLNKDEIVGFEVPTAVVMKSSIYWDVTPCSPLKVNRRFGETYSLHLQGRRISRARNQHKEDTKQGCSTCWFLIWLIIRPYCWRRYVPPKHGSTFKGLHGGISQKTELFKDEISRYYFQQDGAIAHTARASMTLLRDMFGDRIISKDIWPPRSPDFKPPDYYL
jgi:hypothetical protein